MNKDTFRKAVPPTPEHFIQTMDETLGRIENMNRKNAYRTSRVLLIAAVIAVLLAGTALAVGVRFGIFEFMNRVSEPIVPLEGAETVIQSGVAEESCKYGTVRIEEAAYSGGNYTIVVNVASAEGVSPWFPELKIRNAEYEEYGLGDQQFEDGSISFHLEGVIIGEAPKELDCKLTVNFANNNEMLGTVAVPFRLEHSEGLRAKLIPEGEGERWSVESAEVSFGKLTGTLDVRYRYAPLPDEDMGVDVVLFTASGERLPSGGGSGEYIVQEDGTAIYRWITEIQSMAELPEKLILRPKVIGEDKWLDAIECRVEGMG